MQSSSTNKSFPKRFFKRQGLSSPAASPAEDRKAPSLPKQAESTPSWSFSMASQDLLEPPPSAAASGNSPVSPNTQRRRFQWKLFEKAPFFNKSTTSVPPPSRNPKICVRQASLDHSDDISPGDCIPTSPLDPPSSPNVDDSDLVESPNSTMDPKSSSIFPFNKSKLTSIRPKPFLNYSTSSPCVDSLWKPCDGFVWRHEGVGGGEVQLRGTRIEYLSEAERQAFAKMAMQKLQKAQLGCSITRPKDNPVLKQKRQTYQKKKAHTVNVVEKRQSQQSSQQIFGVPLYICIENEKLAEQKCRSLDMNERQPSPQGTPETSYSSRLLSHESSRSSLSDLLSGTESSRSCTKLEDNGIHQSSSSSENLPAPTSLSFSTSTSPTPTPISLSPSPKTSSSASTVFREEIYQPHNVQVPRIVEACTSYLKQHGLSTVGLFRVDGSARRCRNLRVMLDSGKEVVFTDEEQEHQPQDIATLLKQYLRDLPDPLLTTELYPAFLAVPRVPEDRRVEILRYLLGLLPQANVDTLLVVLRFLQDVTKHSYDTMNDDGILISGNKMNARNLATIFAPSLLRSGSAKPMQNLADNDSVIDVTDIIICNVDQIFFIPASLQNDILKSVGENDPEGLDRIINNYKIKEREPEEMETTVFYTSQEESCPEEVIHESDGSTIIKTKGRITPHTGNSAHS